MEPANPVLESAVEGIYVLDVIDAGNDAPTGRDIDRTVGYADLFDGGGQHAAPVGAQDRIQG
jgi:hypothetical protein